MKAIRLLAVAVCMMAGLLFLVGQNHAVAQEIDKEGAKGPWILHCLDGIVTGDPECTHWLQILLYVRPDSSTFSCWNGYHCYDWIDNGDGLLSPSDIVYMEWNEVRGSARSDTTCYMMHVSEVTITLELTLEPDHLDTMYVEFENGFTDVGPAYVDEAIFPPVECDTLHEVWPRYCPRYHLSSWIDNGDGYLSVCDTIDITDLETMEVTYWHVEDVAVDITLDSHASVECPEGIPTMTQWGVIILVALLVGSAVFIMRRRRKASVPA